MYKKVDMNTEQQTLVHSSYEKIKEAIIQGKFAPGKKLRIAELQSLFNIGPTPIREALSRLTATGLVEAVDNRGFFVKNISVEEVQDIYETFTKIECLALDQAIALGDASWEANIVAALYKLGVVEKDPHCKDVKKWLSCNYEFHYALVAGCGSLCLLKIRHDLYLLFERFCHVSFLLQDNFLAPNFTQHQKIADAVLARDAKKACALTTEHLQQSFQQIIPTFQPKK